MKRLGWILLALVAGSSVSRAQYAFYRYDSLKVFVGLQKLQNPWAGGINFASFSPLDVNEDGVDDLLTFDKSGDRPLTFINRGVANTVDYVHTPHYQGFLPPLRHWVLAKDYNCDGKHDIFTASALGSGIEVYKNISTMATGLNFALAYTMLKTVTLSGTENLYMNEQDTPALIDVDNDGDLDVLTFALNGSTIDYHKNLSMENFGHCDSLKFELKNMCWGYFSESAGTNSLTLFDTCALNVANPQAGGNVGGARHSGSTLLALDMDNDGDKDLVIGDLSYKSLTLVTNGGTPTNASITAQDNAFPSNSTPVDIQLFPAVYHIDVNNDGKRDLIAAPSAKNVSRNHESAWYYRNNGTDNAPVFALQQENFLQDGMIDVGEGCYPVLFDYDADGLKDLLISNYGYYDASGIFPSQIAVYRNQGTATAPEFKLVTEDYENLSTSGLQQNLYPTFGDIDNDGDADMFVGENTGLIHYFENIAGPSNQADFVLAQPNYKDATNTTIDVGGFSTPFLFDVDNDSDLDLLIGERSGNINYYQNTGSATTPSFTLVNDTIGGVVITEAPDPIGFSVPFMFRDATGTQLFVGSNSGRIWHFNNIDGNIQGQFNFVTNLVGYIKDGIRSAVAVADMDQDGYLDLFCGNYAGGIGYYTGTLFTGQEETPENFADFKIYPNPAKEEVVLEVGENQSRFEVNLYEITGKLLFTAEYSQSSGTIIVPLSGFVSGLYLLEVVGDNEQKSARLVISR